MKAGVPAGWTSAAAPWTALLGVAVWAAWPGAGTLLVATGLAVTALLLHRPLRLLPALGLMVILGTVTAGYVHLDRVREIRSDWRAVWAGEEERIAGEVQRALRPILEGGPSSASRVADLAAGGNVPDHRALARIRERGGFHAAAVFDRDGTPLVWDGDHRGRVPDEVARGESEFLYRDLPLASYLYVTWPVEGGGTAVVASLIRTDVPDQVRRAAGDFETRFRERTGASIRIQPPDRVPPGQGVFDLNWGETALFSVTVEAEREPELLARLDRLARVWGTCGAVLAWLLLALGRPAGPPRAAGEGVGAAAGTALALALLLPVEALVPGTGLADPTVFLLLDLPLARWLAIVTAAGILSGLLALRRRLPAWASGVAIAGLFALVARGWRAGASRAALAGPAEQWLPLVVSLALGLTVLTWMLLSAVRGRRTAAAVERLASGWVLALLLPAAAALAAGVTPGLPGWAPALWGLPVLIWGAPGLYRLRRRPVLVWIAAGVLGGGAAIPFLWGDRIQARMALSESQVERLGAQEDPFLEFLLARLSFTVDSLAAEGVRPVELLYGAWRTSGLAEASYPVFLTLWTEGGFPRENLPIGMPSASLPALAYALNAPEPGAAMRILRPETAEAHYAAQIPVGDGRVVTAIVPPVQQVGKELLLGPLFGSLEETWGPTLTMIPVPPGESVPRDSLVWRRQGNVWRGEMGLTYPQQRFHAHFDVGLPGPGAALAEATLLLAAVLLLAGLLRAAGRGVRDVTAWPRLRARLGWPGSFRARVTLALFGFFSVSNLLFGTVAYRTITGASQRAAQVLAERVVADAAAAYPQSGGQVELVAQRVGSDLLEYRGALLHEGSPEPLVELGLYEGWVPFSVHRALANRETVVRTMPTVVGDWSYVTAYQRLPDGSVLAAPVPLEAGASAVRSQEVIRLLAFAMIAGVALSILLAVLVGRALARPIQALRIASERVGSGNLTMRLPTDRSDEFGAVFQAFNRMVRRLRRARRSLVRNTRRTRTIVEDAATGVVALDPEGGVTLANGRARALLEADIQEGAPLARAGAAARELAVWVGRMNRDRLEEAGTEMQVGDRRLRVQARRITREAPHTSGVVLSVEDVTDELRSERILAWGEMARQVAHEVKNPLTPMKLSVQHLRRAWEDRRPDFGEILDRNAEAMLREIVRLAGIASGFSRFGAPGTSAAPLEAVAIAEVVDETMALYNAGPGPVTFRVQAEAGLPRVHARRGEVKEVLVNLLENARAAIDGEGEVRVAVRRTEGGVALRVCDDGVGIPPDLLPRIFEPHFSTRSSGTGLGLAIVRRIVESWGASVSVTSGPGRGTEAEVVFPT
ncbi:MAG: ATP-binding protein [Longimicrobiales bacterium]|nr:ATP-binding protein [Longimicrobiales bacterium]